MRYSKRVSKLHQPDDKTRKDRVAKIRFDLAQEGITPERWELEALVRGATVIYGDKKFKYAAADEWPGFSIQEEWK